MDDECYQNGQCKICHCETTALQMANKACDKPCYPRLFNKRSWNYFKVGNRWVGSDGFMWLLQNDLSLLKKKV